MLNKCFLACFVLLVHCGMLGVTQAQIRYLTVPTIRSPLPPMALFPGSTPGQPPAPGVVAPVPAQIARPPAVPVKPSLTKDELDKRVVEFQKQRAEDGSASAQYQLGLRYLNGDGVEKDVVTARKWLDRAAAGGSSEAKSKLERLVAAPK